LAFAPAAFAQGGIEAVFSDKHTLIFILINVGLTLYFAAIRFDRFAVVHGPEILTTVGIFGCFLGIALALLNFDAAKVSTSVPQLLEGVKTAFWASVTGVGGSLVIRFRHKMQKVPIPMGPGAAKSASLDDVVNALASLQKSLSGTEEGTLLSSLKLMRQDQNDQLGKLRESFDTFAAKMAEDGSKALIDALRSVIADFNAQINEQFGENFKHLNAAVEKLVLWQQQYKDELDKLQAVQQSSAADLRSAASNFSDVTAKSAVFADCAAGLEKLLQGIAQQYKLIEESEQTLSVILREMKDVTPTFARKLDELSAAFRDGVTKVQSDVSEVTRNLGVQLQSSHGEMKKLLVDSLKNSQTEIADQHTNSLNAVRDSVRTLDKALQEELTKSLETLGRQLASLSEKFVADYTPLTERLREVVRLARSVGG
jgi:hypothetical protein